MAKIKVVKHKVSEKDKARYAKERKELEAGYEKKFGKKMPTDEEHAKESKAFISMPDPIAHAHKMSKDSPKTTFKKSMKDLERISKKKKND